MSELSKQRTDVTQSFEDFERIMEDYFQVIPPDIDFFEIEKCSYWDYDDMENTVTFYFEDEWYLQEFLDELEECPKLRFTFDMDDSYSFDGVDRQNLRITIVGKTGGLLG